MSTEIPDQPTYWLLTWLESQKIKTPAQAKASLGRPSTLHELRDKAEEWAESVKALPPGLNLVAGTGLRLNDDLTCPSPSCRRQQVDVLFRHAWHYFDRVLLPDGVGDLLRHRPAGWSTEYLEQVLLNMIDVILHIQQLGASPLVHYYPRTETSLQGVIEALGRQGGDSWGDSWDEAWSSILATLIEKGHYEFERLAARRFIAHCDDPFLHVRSPFEFELDKSANESEDVLRARAAHLMMHPHIANLEEDLVARQLLVGPLGSAIWSHERVLSHLSKSPEAADVIFRISLPSLAYVPIRELISLRVADGDAFMAFRGALTKAAQQMLASNRASAPEAVAGEIVRDVVEPELARLRQRLRSAKRSLARKTAVSVTLAGVTTTCGLLFGVGPIVAGLAGVASLLSGAAGAASKYFDEKQAVEISDMFFLWKALDHAE